jgi:hypothetical protein
MSIIKRANKVAFAKTPWGTRTQPTTGDQMFVETNSPPSGERELITNAETYSVGLESQVCTGPFTEASGSFDGKMHFEDPKLLEILASIFGSYEFTVDTPVAGVNEHKFVGQRVLTADISHTYAFDEGSQVKAVDWMKFMSFVIALDGVYKHTSSYMGTKVDPAPGFTTPLAVTGSDDIPCFLNENTIVLLNAQGAAALANPTDKQNTTDYGLSLERGLQSEPPTSGTNVISNINDGLQYTFRPTLNYPRKTTQNEDFLAGYHNKTLYKMSIGMTSGTLYITGTIPYSMTFYFPQLYIDEPPTYDQETPIATSVSMMSQWDEDSAATGMAYGVPYAIVHNTQTTLSGYPAVTET